MWRYWLDFCWVPAVALAIAIADCRSLAWVLVCVCGVLAWTLTEYWVHRSLLHVVFWHGAHERHHQHPAEYVTAIWWYTPLLFAALWFVLPHALFVGVLVGYLGFLAMHHTLHHVDLRTCRPWLQRYAIWHNRHHKLTACNYGVTTSLWDVVFRTSR